MKLARILVLLFSLPAFAAHSVTLTWTASTSASVDHYKVFRATVSGGPYQLLGNIPATQLTFTNGSNPDGTPLAEGAVYFYVVQSVASGVSSVNSNEAGATIPTTPQPPTNLKAVGK